MNDQDKKDLEPQDDLGKVLVKLLELNRLTIEAIESQSKQVTFLSIMIIALGSSLAFHLWNHVK